MNVDATVRGISMITGEVRSLNLASGNYEAVEAKNFSKNFKIIRKNVGGCRLHLDEEALPIMRKLRFVESHFLMIFWSQSGIKDTLS